MNSEVLKKRYKKFAIDLAFLIKDLQKNTINIAYSNQLIRSFSSPGANYSSVCRAKSTADFTNNLKIVEDELDKSFYFPELVHFFNTAFNAQFDFLIKEVNELLAITVSSILAVRKKNYYLFHTIVNLKS
jgi:four helix bundle protein